MDSNVRYRVIGGLVHAIPFGACAYCHADAQRSPKSKRAPSFHCSDCDRHIGKTRIHTVRGTDVICLRCYERWNRETNTSLPFSSRAAAAIKLGLWP